MVDGIGIGWRRSLGLAFLGQQRAAQIDRRGRVGAKRRSGNRFDQVVIGNRLVAEGQIVLVQFVEYALADGAARDDHARKAGNSGVFALAVVLVRRSQQRDGDGPGIKPQQLADRDPDRRRFGQPAGAKLTAGHRPFIGIEHRDAVIDQCRHVAARRGVFPHPDIHRRNRQHRLVGGEQQRGGQIIGNPARHLGHQIGRGRADHDQIRLPRQLDMPHLDLVLEVP